jgi:hypothetical protein
VSKLVDVDQYVISDGDKYSYREKSGRWSFTTDIKKADKFIHSKAQNILECQFSKKERINLKIEKYIKDKPILVEVVKEILRKEYEFDFNNISTDFQKFYSNLLKYRTKIKIELEDIEKEKCDLEHYIEFSRKASGSDGYKMYRDYRDCRVRRRELKNESLRIDILLESKPENFADGNASRRLAGIETQKYEPRILKELFEVS